MQGDTRKRVIRKTMPLLVGAAYAVALLPFARLGVDPHHDGVMLHPALMVERGFVVHRDVFSQNGPLTSIVQAGFIFLLGPSLLSIRVGSCILLACTGAVLFSLNRRFFGTGVATVAMILSLCLTYFFSPTSPMHPWPSDLMVFLVSLCGWLLSRGLESAEPRKSFFLLFLAGFVGSWVPFVRQSVGVVLLLLAMAAAVVLHKRWLLPVFVGIGSGIAVAMVYLISTSSVSEFWQQSVTGPWSWAIGERGEGGWSSVRGNLINTGLAGVALLLLGTLLLNRIITMADRDRHTPRFWGLLLVSSSLFVLAQSDGSVLQINRESLLWTLGVSGLGYVFLALLRLGVDGTLSGTTLIATCVLATATVSIFPVTDVRHAYWAFIPLIGTGVFLISRGLHGTHTRAFGGVILCALVGFQTVTAIQRTVRIPRATVVDVPVLRHMLFDRDYLEFFRLRFAQIATLRRLHPDAMVFNICSDGLFASLGAIKALPDPYFVSWNFGIDFFNPDSEVGRARLDFVSHERPIVWMCPLTENPEQLALQYGLRLLPGDPKISTVDQFSWWPYISYLGVPSEWNEQDSKLILQ